jgi:hypothetical protein
MNKFAALWLCCAMITGALLFQTSQRVTDGRQRLAHITADMRREEDTLRVLQAEWSYLNQPERLEKLSAQYLKLAPMKGRQFIAAADIPQRPAPPSAGADNDTPAPAGALQESILAANMVTTGAQGTHTGDIAMPLRKPPGLRLPAAYTPPHAALRALKPEMPETQAAKPPRTEQKAAAAESTAGRSFLDVLDSLGGGAAR